MPKTNTINILFLLAIFLLTSCAGTGYKAGPDWERDETRFFDDGIDVLSDLSALSGKWAYDAKEELDGRCQLADFVGIVKIVSVQTTEDLNGQESKRITLKVQKKLYGTKPEGALILISSKNSSGYQVIKRHEHRLDESFVLFARFFMSDGKLKHHFHLSTASEKIKADVIHSIDLRLKEEEKLKAKIK